MFYLADWKEDFFALLYSHILEVREKEFLNFQDLVLIFPTSRARHICVEYFKQYAKQDENIYDACFLPEMLTVEEWLNMCQLFWHDKSIFASKQIDSLESIFILYEVVKKIAKSNTKASEKAFFHALLGDEEGKKESFFHKPLHSFAYFYSYGEFLHTIIQECFEENTLAFAVENVEHEVEDFLAYILKNIRIITLAYIEVLKKEKKTTKPYSKFVLAKKIEEKNNDMPLYYQDKYIFFCGLDRLTKTEEFFAKAFTENRKRYVQSNNYELAESATRSFSEKSAQMETNAHISFIFCSDPLLASEPEKAHWSSAQYSAWARRWGQNFELIIPKQDTLTFLAEKRQNIHFYKAFDFHSQFQSLNIDKSCVNQKTACVLNTEDALLPLLYSLYPNYTKSEELNITMGYTLKYTKIVELLHTLFKLKSNKRDYYRDEQQASLYNRSDLIDLLSFAYFSDNILAIKKDILDSEKAYIDPLVFFKNKANIRAFFEAFLDNFVSLDTLQKTSNFIDYFSSIIKEQLHDNPLERLTLLRLEKIARSWEERAYKDLQINFDLCFALLIDKIENEHVPFTHHSDEALQVMGLLETKLLSFDTVHIFDSNEEFLPRKASDNPLLPEKLRPYLGLLTSHEKELYYAHTWYRLIASSKNVHIYWQEASAKGLLDSKKSVSSYVEEIIWEVEQKNKALLDENSKEFTQASCPIELKENDHYVLTNPHIKAKIADLLEGGISASRIDSFLACPLRFFYESVCGFRQEAEIKEGEDNAALGNFVHDFMQDFYEEKKEAKKEKLIEIFNKKIKNFDEMLEEKQLHDNFPPESLLLLKHSFEYRIRKFIEKQADTTFIEAIEKELIAEVAPKVKLRGKLDRIDKRKNEEGLEEIVVLDYKSFSIANKLISEKFWQLDDFFDGLAEVLNDFDIVRAKELVEILYKNTQSVQLFVYMYLAKKNQYRITNAAYIDLYESCEEKKIIFDKNEEKVIIEEKIPLILKFLTHYIQEITCFEANRHTKCDWCSFKKYCI